MCGQGWTNVLCRVRESGGAIYRFRARAIHKSAISVSLSDFGLKDDFCLRDI